MATTQIVIRALTVLGLLAQMGCGGELADDLNESEEDGVPLDGANPRITLRAPTLSTGAPLPAPVTTKTTALFSVKATDNVKVTRVELYDSAGRIATSVTGTTTGNYSFSVALGPWSTGTQSFYAVAYDGSGGKKASARVPVVVNMTGNTSDSLVTESAVEALLDAELAHRLDPTHAAAPDIVAFGTNAASYIPQKFDAAATSRLRHSMPKSLASLALAYAARDLDGAAFTSCERLALLRVMEEHATRLIGVNEISRKYVVGNIRLRQAFGLHGAGLLLSTQMPKAAACTTGVVASCPTCAATGAAALAMAEAALAKALNSAQASPFINFTLDGHYVEGFSYANFVLEILAPNLIIRDRYAGTNVLHTKTLEGQPNLIPAFLRWFADSQRFDGTWTPLDDSTGVKQVYELESMMSLLAERPASSTLALSDEQDLLTRLRRADCRSAANAVDSDRWARVFFPRTTPTWKNLDCATLGDPPHEALYSQGGHLHLKSPTVGLSASFFNEGAWYPSKTRVDWNAYLSGASGTPTGFLPLFFFDFPGRPALPAGPIVTSDYAWAPAFLGSTADAAPGGFWNPRDYTHVHFMDGHFEISAFGKNLLIGPGFSPYDTQFPIDEARLPRAQNLVEVNGVFPKTNLLTPTKVEKLPSSAGGLAVYRLESDLSDRFVIDGEGRFVIVFDRLRPSAIHSVVARYHGRDNFTTATSQTLSQGGKTYAFQSATWSFKETLRDGTVLPGADPSIKLHAYVGVPQTHGQLSAESALDSCNDVDYLPNIDRQLTLNKYCQHQTLKIANQPGVALRGIPVLFWPERDGGGGWEGITPSVVWDVTNDSAGNLSAVGVHIVYTRPDGSRFDKKLHFAFTGASASAADFVAP